MGWARLEFTEPLKGQGMLLATNFEGLSTFYRKWK